VTPHITAQKENSLTEI